MLHRRETLTPFVPARGLENGHAQTLYAHFLRPRHRPRVDRECWTTSDGDVLELDWLRCLEPRAPHVLVLHGLEGSTEASYVASVLRLAAVRGWGAVAVNFRGCAAPNRLARSYHAGETDDAAAVAARLRERADGAPVVAIGFSLGANVILKLLADSGDRAPIDAAATISAPYDLAATADLMDRSLGLTATYRLRFLHHLRRKALRKAREFPGTIDARAAARLARTTSLREFDELFTAPVHGFRGADEYYARSSAGDAAIRAIRRPTLLISAADDPLVPGAQFPQAAVDANPLVDGVLLPHGGHVGFVAGTVAAPHFWAEHAAIEWLRTAALSVPNRSSR